MLLFDWIVVGSDTTHAELSTPDVWAILSLEVLCFKQSNKLMFISIHLYWLKEN